MIYHVYMAIDGEQYPILIYIYVYIYMYIYIYILIYQLGCDGVDIGC